ncbi:MAG: hypothetical protein M3Q71_05730 [Chloroflexota bacterium]|nr:hypothetical protein [Chloroflexota bacterium]
MDGSDIAALVAAARKNREGIVKFARQTLGWEVSDQDISSITVMTPRLIPRTPRGRSLPNEARPVKIEVGKPLDNRLSESPGEPVLAILKSNAYLVCTPNHGVLRGEPYFFGTEQVRDVNGRRPD